MLNHSRDRVSGVVVRQRRAHLPQSLFQPKLHFGHVKYCNVKHEGYAILRLSCRILIAGTVSCCLLVSTDRTWYSNEHCFEP